MEVRIAGNQRPAKFPIRLRLHQFRPHWIGEDVKTHSGKRVLFPLFLPQHMIVDLGLQTPLPSCW